jgi:hypothetical protein
MKKLVTCFGKLLFNIGDSYVQKLVKITYKLMEDRNSICQMRKMSAC